MADMTVAPTIDMPPPQDQSPPDQIAGPTAQSTMASLGQPKTQFGYDMAGGTMNTLAQGAQQLVQKAKMNKAMVELFSKGEGIANETVKSAIQECGPDIQQQIPPKSVSIKNGQFDPLDYSMRIYTAVLEWRKEHPTGEAKQFLQESADMPADQAQAEAQRRGLSDNPHVASALKQKTDIWKQQNSNTNKDRDRQARLDIAALGRKMESWRLSIEQNKGKKDELGDIVKALQTEIKQYDADINNAMTDPNDVTTLKMNKKTVEGELKDAYDAWKKAVPGASGIGAGGSAAKPALKDIFQ